MSDLAPHRQGELALDGHSIHWEYFGKGDREAVALLNGLAMHCKAWYGFLPRLLPELDVVLYDYPGQGESSAHDVPCSIDRIAGYLKDVLDAAAVGRAHVMGISYGGFVGLEFARQFQERLHTLTLSGILLSHEQLFEMYEALSLRFYSSGPLAFEIYTHYMYEKIFGESFVQQVRPKLEKMRQGFEDRWKDRLHCFVRLTEAQNPFFESLDANLPAYRAIRTPTLIMAGAEDRAIPPWQQAKLLEILPNARQIIVPGSGHMTYMERPDLFWPAVRRLFEAKSVVW